MNFGLFSLMTITGSAIWCYILAYLGQKAYGVEPELLTDPEALVRFIHGQSTWILVVVAIFAALYILSMRLSRPSRKSLNGS
jgi:membrane protein DedA with SNARE-associated domain